MSGWNKWIAIFILFIIPTIMLPYASAIAAPGISAKAAAVIDVSSGRILYEKNGHDKMRVASLTKIMTAIVAIEEGNIKDVVTVPKYAVGTEGSSIYLKNGEKLTLENLLYGLMLRSGNDAAVTIADHVGGSLEGFAKLMNEKAEYVGLTETHFTNPHGLDDSDEHFSSAIDMAKITAYALRNPEFKKIVATEVKNIPKEGETWDRKLYNKNKMLRLYEGADGVKTGYTKLAKRCLVSSATRNGRQIAVVTLNDPNDWDDHARLLDYGFQNFKQTKIIGANEPIDPEQGLYALNEFSFPLAAGEENQVQKKITMENGLKELLPGGVAGYIHIYLGDQEIGKIGLVRKEKQANADQQTKSIWLQILYRVESIVWGGL